MTYLTYICNLWPHVFINADCQISFSVLSFVKFHDERWHQTKLSGADFSIGLEKNCTLVTIKQTIS